MAAVVTKIYLSHLGCWILSPPKGSILLWKGVVVLQVLRLEPLLSRRRRTVPYNETKKKNRVRSIIENIIFQSFFLQFTVERLAYVPWM
jgi:hypothetical protein